MKKILSIFIAFFAIMFLMPNVYAETSIEMTAEDLIETAESDVVKLENDIILTTNLVVPEDIKVLDLNGHIITLKGVKEFSSGLANPIVVNSKLEIKNGTIARYVASEDSNELSLLRGSIVMVSGSSADLVLNKVTLDGKNLDVQTSTDRGAYALFIINGASVTINDSKLINNNVITDTSNWGSTLYGKNAKSIILNNTEVSNNSNEDSNRGGIIYINSTEKVEINNSIISNNTVVENGVVTIGNCGSFVFDKDSIIKNNEAAEAAGIHVTDTNSTIAGTIEGNEAIAADGIGGALYTVLSDTTKTVTLTDTAVIKNNKAAAGAGILVNGPDGNNETGMVIINGATITGNTSLRKPDEGNLRDGGGAGIYVYRGALTINDVTIENNTSVDNIGSAIVVSHQNRNIKAGKLTINGGTINGTIALAMGEIKITGGTYSVEPDSKYIETPYIAKKVGDIYVIGLDEEEVSTDSTEVDVEEEVTEVQVGVAEVDKEEVNDVLLDTLAKDGLVTGETGEIEVKLEITTEDVSEEAKEDIEEAMEEENLTIVEFFDATVNVYVDEDYVGSLDELTSEVKLTVMLPADLQECEEGYKRVFYIIRKHGNKVEKLEAQLSEDGTYLTVGTDKFSTYAIAYEDVEEELLPPQTGDSIITYIMIGFISLIAFAVSGLFLKRKFN